MVAMVLINVNRGQIGFFDGRGIRLLASKTTSTTALSRCANHHYEPRAKLNVLESRQ
jgi:hypothetical protein